MDNDEWRPNVGGAVEAVIEFLHRGLAFCVIITPEVGGLAPRGVERLYEETAGGGV